MIMVIVLSNDFSFLYCGCWKEGRKWKGKWKEVGKGVVIIKKKKEVRSPHGCTHILLSFRSYRIFVFVFGTGCFSVDFTFRVFLFYSTLLPMARIKPAFDPSLCLKLFGKQLN